jgi:hypothetical protein
MRLSCPIPSSLDPAAESVDAATVVWSRRLGLPDVSRARFGILAARCFPQAHTSLQLMADWISLFCAIDDAIERVPPEYAPARLASWRDLLTGTALRGDDEPVARACFSFAARLEGDFRRPLFLQTVGTLFTAFVAERAAPFPLHADSYLALRTVTAGIQPLLALAGWDPANVLGESARSAARLVGVQNDLMTWRREEAAGEGNNLVIVYSTVFGVSLEAAAASVISLHDAEMRAFLLELEASAKDDQVGQLRHVVRGHLDWAAETGRYDPQEERTSLRGASTGTYPRPQTR